MNYFTSMPYNDFRLREPIKRSLEDQVSSYRYEREKEDMKKKGFKPEEYAEYFHSEMRKMGLNPKKPEDCREYDARCKQKYKDEYLQSIGLRRY